MIDYILTFEDVLDWIIASPSGEAIADPNAPYNCIIHNALAHKYPHTEFIGYVHSFDVHVPIVPQHSDLWRWSNRMITDLRVVAFVNTCIDNSSTLLTKEKALEEINSEHYMLTYGNLESNQKWLEQTALKG